VGSWELLALDPLCTNFDLDIGCIISSPGAASPSLTFP
jgi:hypothetical protein